MPGYLNNQLQPDRFGAESVIKNDPSVGGTVFYGDVPGNRPKTALNPETVQSQILNSRRIEGLNEEAPDFLRRVNGFANERLVLMGSYQVFRAFVVYSPG